MSFRAAQKENEKYRRKGNYRLESTDCHSTPVWNLVLGLTRAVSEDITWEVMELESWNHKDFFFHYSTDHYMRSVEIHSLGRCTSSSQQGWCSSECPMASMVLGSRSPHSAFHVLTCFSETLTSSTAFLVRWACARLGAGNPRAGLGYREISPTDHSLLS